MERPLVALVLAALVVGAGAYASPFPLGALPGEPIAVDAIPDTGENQQIVFTEWPGRAPRDIEDQVSYPLTTALMGVPGVQTVRSSSAFGFSTIHVIFEPDVEFYWARARILEKLASLPTGLLPDGVSPRLGPDATALGQVFWYTLEGRDPDGETVGGWDLDELRSVQDWTVRMALQAVDGVAEVASVGGFVREYQVDVDPESMRAFGVSLPEVVDAVRGSNLDVGARTMEVNGVEYVIRGLGRIQSLDDLRATVVTARDSAPVRVGDIGRVTVGPASRRGALDDEGGPAVGGVVVARYGANPRAVIDGVKSELARLQPTLPRRTLEDGTQSQVTIIPFYDRAKLIDETLQTLSVALARELLITVIVVLVLLRRLRGALLVCALPPLGVLGAFACMKAAGVEANVMALGGIAIAIGTMVDIGIVFVENIARQRDQDPGATARAVAEVAPAVVTSVATTVIGFLPVFGLTNAELRLFAPLALAKTFAMLATLLLALLILPTLTQRALSPRLDASPLPSNVARIGAAITVLWLLAQSWTPLGAQAGWFANLVFVIAILGVTLLSFRAFEVAYPRLLAWVLQRKLAFLTLPAALVLFGATVWLGFERTLPFLPQDSRAARALPGLGREYMPPFDEGAFLYMPTTMPHASIGEALGMLSRIDAAIAQIPEVDRVVGKLGRADTALDPAPVSMIETIITYVPEYHRDENGDLERRWRDHIRRPRDIWNEIVKAAEHPGLTSAPILMPIEARRVMLQSGMRAPMGLQVQGPDASTVEAFGRDVAEVLRQVPALRPETVFAERVVGKPYLEIELEREALGRHGLSVAAVQRVLEAAIGGVTLTQTIEGRERYPVRVRYMREERDSFPSLERVLVPTPDGSEVPLSQLASLRYETGPQVLRSENTFPTSFVIFDRHPNVSEVEAVEAAAAALQAAVDAGQLRTPTGVSHAFTGTYVSQVRSERRLALLVPLALALILVLLQLQFRRLSTSLTIFFGVLVAASGGFTLIWLYDQPWFLAFELFGTSMRDIFRVDTVNMSVAVWVGFIALVGIATDDGVLMSTFLRERYASEPPQTASAVRRRTIEAGVRRVRPCLMTTATTILALLPVVSSQGRGADIMMPMALPSVGGMAAALLTLLVVPTISCALEERRLNRRRAP